MSDTSSKASNPLASDPGGIGDEALQALHARMLREKEEPSEGFSLVPIFLIFLFAGLTFWSGLYMANRAGGFRADVYDDHWRKGESGAAEDPDVVRLRLGTRIFKAQCAQCHGPEGLGQPGTYPPLAKSPWPVGNPARPIRIVLAGMSGPINVLGNAFSNAMPAVGSALKDKEIAAVLTFVRGSFGNNDVPVEESDVADARAQIGNRGPWTPDEVLKLFPLEASAPAAPVAPVAAPAN